MPLTTGIIALWSGAVGAIPAGWTLCDGTAGTPDLRDNFVVGAGSTYAPDANGGTVNHTHTGSTDGHQHQLTAGVVFQSGTGVGPNTTPNSDTFTSDATDNLPPYYALAYIMNT